MDSSSTAPSGTPPPAQQPPPPQTRETESHSASTPLKQPMLTPEGGPRPPPHAHMKNQDWLCSHSHERNAHVKNQDWLCSHSHERKG